MVVLDPLEVGGEPGFGLRLAVQRAGGGLGDGLEELAADLVEQREVELALRGEVLVQHRLGDAGRVGHVVHRRAVEALAGEHLEADGEQLLPTGRGRQAGRHGYRMVTPTPGPCRRFRVPAGSGSDPRARSSFSAAFTA